MKMKTSHTSTSASNFMVGSTSRKTLSSRASLGGCDTNTTEGGFSSMIGGGGGGNSISGGDHGTTANGLGRSSSRSPSIDRDDDALKPRLSQAKRQWSIQAVKGKVTTKCLWNACKALTAGVFLIFIGAAMATIG